jgi:AcrR family transcriptional regulator
MDTAGSTDGPATALDDALEVFRTRGFATPSDRELGLGAGGPFTSRQQLWLACLQRYRDDEASRTLRLLHDQDVAPLERVRRVVRTATALGLDDPAGGCLVVNAACERGGRDPATSELVDDEIATLERDLVAVLELAMEDGSLRREVDPEDLAATIATLVQGLRVVTRVDGAQRRTRAVLREVDRQLDAALAPG